MISPENLKITFPILTNGADSAILIGYSPLMEYDADTKKRTKKQIGTGYEIVIPSNNYEKLLVKIKNDLKPTINLEELENKAIKCGFKNFKAKFYRDYKSNSYLLTASADSIIILNDYDDAEISLS